MDGDSFAHRAFHALPRTLRRDDGGPANTLIGFTSMLLRLWKAEQPRAVVVAWDTIGVPTYRNALLPTYQSGREFDPEIVDQLALLPALVASTAAPPRPPPTGPGAPRRSSPPPIAMLFSWRRMMSPSSSRYAA
jgi:5'-3' exonuclease